MRRAGSAAVTYRAATDADVAAQHAVFVAAEGGLLERHAFGWPAPPPMERTTPGYRHLLRHDAERCFVAETDGRVVGFSGAFVRGQTWFLAALFVAPDQQGMGIGRRLFDLAFSGAPERRITITDSIQPVSNALYAAHGLLPTTPILEFAGHASVEAPAELTASEPDTEALAHLDRAVYGFDRAVDHVFWATQAKPTLWLRGATAVAYSYRWPNGRIGPLAARDGGAAALALRAELARQPNPWLEVPGTSRSLVEAALAAGLRIVVPPGLLLLSKNVAPPTTLAISGYGLF
ncbi:MAG: GNAT family N-acetyltransferase [Candidatus Limnocylindrales bacterium]